MGLVLSREHRVVSAVDLRWAHLVVLLALVHVVPLWIIVLLKYQFSCCLEDAYGVAYYLCRRSSPAVPSRQASLSSICAR